MNHTRFILAFCSAAVGYVVFVSVGLMAIRGEVDMDPLWPTLGAVAIITVVMAYVGRRVYHMTRRQPGLNAA